MMNEMPKSKMTFVSFARGQWNQADWLLVRSPRWQETSYWIQDEDGIRNHLPEDIRAEDMQMGRDRTGETYISMLYKTPFRGNCRFALECAIIDRMAPLIVLSPKLAPVHEDHLEFVLYDRGINIWHHYWDGEKPSWKLLAYLDLALEREIPHRMELQIITNKKGAFAQIACKGKVCGARLDCDWLQEYYAGFTGCEGKNKFYSFEAEEDFLLTDTMKERFSD